ncbi:MAG: hypothetical protein JO225_08905 [Candidatus Eremiobacteraeota bacterium]|nr:hypothetical protein [Candidatus Eremiobacteraeota bacterium]
MTPLRNQPAVNPWPLSIAFPLTLAGAVALMLAFDAVSALFARRTGFPYRNLWRFQFLCYVIIGFIAMLTLLDLRLVEAVGAITGLIEATAGWTITWRIGPGRVPDATPSRIAITIAAMTAFAFGLAIIGAILFNFTAGLLARSAMH